MHGSETSNPEHMIALYEKLKGRKATDAEKEHFRNRCAGMGGKTGVK